MSTKTSIKRIAAVAAVALTLGGFSAVSAHATNTNTGNVLAWCSTGSDSSGKTINVAGNNACTGVAGPANSVTVSVDATSNSDAASGLGSNPTAAHTASAAYVVLSGAGAYFTGSTSGTTGDVTLATGTNPTSAAVVSAGTGTLTIATPTVGTITVSYYEGANGIYAATAAETVTITVGTASVANIYSTSSVYGFAGVATSVDSVTATTDAALLATPVVAPAATLNTAVVSFKVVQKDALGNALDNTATKAVTINATIGAVETTAGTPLGSYAAVAALSNNNQRFYLAADGRSGISTVTIAVNGATVATYSVTFYSTTIAKLTVSAYKPLLAASQGTASATQSAADTTSQNAGVYTKKSSVKIVATDASGNVIAGANAGDLKVTLTSSNAAVATATGTTCAYAGATYGYWLCPVTYVGPGTATITVKDTATGLITGTADFTTSKNVIAKATLTLDADSYTPGSLVTLSFNALGSDGKPVADGYYYGAITSKVKSSQALQSYAWDNTYAGITSHATTDLSVGDISIVNGVGTATFYAPAADFVLTATLGSGANIDPLIQDTALTVTGKVTSGSEVAAQAAIDAAQEATDAANAAYDAANNAMDSADAATAAAQDAADNASAALAAVTSLSATVAKLVKSVAAIAAALAKVQKKIGA